MPLFRVLRRIVTHNSLQVDNYTTHMVLCLPCHTFYNFIKFYILLKIVKSMKIKTLDSHINLTGMTLDLVERDGKIACYEKKRISDGKHISFEIIKISIKKVNGYRKLSKEYNGFDFYEAYPSACQFGSYAWDFGGKDDVKYAREKFDKLAREQNML